MILYKYTGNKCEFQHYFSYHKVLYFTTHLLFIFGRRQAVKDGSRICEHTEGRRQARYRKGRNSDGSIIYASVYGRTYEEAEKGGQVSMNISKPGIINLSDIEDLVTVM